MAYEQEGSRRLQQQLGSLAPPDLAAAVMELSPHLATLATHPFGNYLVSRMAALPPAHAAVHTALRGRVCALMAHPQGSRVVQAALERLPAHLATSLASEVEGRVASLACSTHGSWSVIAAYKLAAAYKHAAARIVVRELAAGVNVLATHQHGSRAVQRVLAEAGSARALDHVSELVEAIVALGAPRLHSLAHELFGNYVVQLALQYGSPPARAALVDALLPHFVRLARCKHGSNVAEALVRAASVDQLGAIERSVHAEAAGLRAHVFGGYAMSALDRVRRCKEVLRERRVAVGVTVG